jgi:hypothetical protein
MSLTVTAVLLLCRFLVRHWAAGTDRHTDAKSDLLRPAELAYLAKGGDMSNVLAVLSFDLLHRAVKASIGDESKVELAPYEATAWQSAKKFVANWGTEQIDKVLPDFQKESFPAITKKISAIYRFFTKTFRAFAGEVLSDPRRIKRYISFAGVAKLVVDLGGAQYKEALKTEMELDLLARGLLVSNERLSGCALVMGLVAAVGAIALITMLTAITPDIRLNLSYILMAAFNCLAVQGILFLRELVPLYSELKEVFAHLQRRSWRLSVLRQAVTVFSVASWLLLIFFCLFLLLMECFALKLTLAVTMQDSACILFALSLNILAVFLLIQDCLALKTHPYPSRLAQALVRLQYERFASVSPVETIRAALLSPEYDPGSSYILALYGIETLWLLA